ncbi:chorion peroxidase [Diachasma alloeum]|uniref:chorion peroxidase n=1 Tax=Diachasma alloeum TaxID=454923 RepID=UPI00073828B8|nr:chorion peroxidase [Diachasma alloeum]
MPIVTERTSLTRSADPPTYVEYAGMVRTRRSRVRQFQCCVCAILLSLSVMAVIMSISYELSPRTPEPNELNSPIEPPTITPNVTTLLQLASPLAPAPSLPDQHVKASEPAEDPTALTQQEWSEAVKIGREAIEDRLKANEMATSLMPGEMSPNIRHSYAVSTGPTAGRLALAGVGEVAASRHIESSRRAKGFRSAFGAYFDGKWSGASTCVENDENVKCDLTQKYRNINGTCNYPGNKGAAFTPFRRALAPVYSDGIEAPRSGKSAKGLPSPREVSLRVHGPSPSSNPSFTVMLAVFGQFIDHDMTATANGRGKNDSTLACCPPSKGHPECFPVAVGPGDPAYDFAGKTCMEFVRSAPAAQCKIGPRQQLNQVTGFIDGSVIYGSDDATASSLRDFKSGKLRMFKTPDGRFLLPRSTDPNDGCNRPQERSRGRYCFASGDARANENLHLTTMHIIWARQHNAVADRLARENPSWSDAKLYQESKRVVGAQLQHITYSEFLPLVLGETEVARRGLRPLSGGSHRAVDDERPDPAIANNFATSAFRFAHSLLPGLMKTTDAQNGTEDYIELHRMLFNPYSLYSRRGVESSVMSATSNNIQRTSPHVTSELTRHLFEDPIDRNEENKPRLPCGLDLVSLNIQRGRDHGLPGYTSWREYCNLTRPENFGDLEGVMNSETLGEIRKIYGEVDDVDLYTGALAEKTTEDGIVGPTFGCLIGDQFQRLQRGDRFWYENREQPHPFSEDQLMEIRKTTLARIICDCSDSIDKIQPQVMRSVDANNPITACNDIPMTNLSLWKEAI